MQVVVHNTEAVVFGQGRSEIGCGNIADNGVLNAVANPAAAPDP
jgi:hypothetical protein